MKLILHYLKRYKLLVFLNVIAIFSFALVELGIPTIIAQMIDVGIAQNDLPFIWKMGALIVTIAVLGGAGCILLTYCSSRISTYIIRDIRNDLFSKVQTFSHAEFNRFGVSSLITRTTNDAFQMMLFVNVLLRTALVTPVMFGVSVALTIRTSAALSSVLACTFPFIVAGVALVAKLAGPLSEKQQNDLDRLNRISRENLTGIRVIRAFGNEDHEQQRFAQTSDDYAKVSKRLFKLMGATQPAFFFLLNLAVLAIFWIAGNMIGNGSLQVGQLVAFLDYQFHAMFSIMLFSMVFTMYPKARVSARRIAQVLDTEPLVQSPAAGRVKPAGPPSVEFDRVTFTYPGGEEPVLRDVSFTAKAGETIAFIGSTGSGKSTLTGLIPRFYDATRGEVRVCGLDVRAYDLQSLRGMIGYIPQKARLFTGTVAENLRFGKEDATEDEIGEAAGIAQAQAFITAKPKGFFEHISEGGANLSGGQKQRLSIARAVIRKPKIYIFDDSFSALDFKTDAALRARLKNETSGAVVLIVAQRVSTIMHANTIIVLDEGRVAGSGTHCELLKACPIYREIAASQFTKEELEKE